MSPILTIRPRYREVGRLRLGEVAAAPGGRSRPQALSTWRLTSPYREPIEGAARLWGGQPSEHDGTYDLVTEASALPVLVPGQDVSGDQWMEEWSAGGLVRRCDGATQHAGEQAGEPCLRIDGQGCACQPTTHLLVVLPDLPELGVWRLTTRGWAAASELPQAVELVLRLSGGGRLPEAVLEIERRSRRSGGTTQHFVVPVLRIRRSLAELASRLPEPADGLELPAPVADSGVTGSAEPPGDAAPAGVPRPTGGVVPAPVSPVGAPVPEPGERSGGAGRRPGNEGEGRPQPTGEGPAPPEPTAGSSSGPEEPATSEQWERALARYGSRGAVLLAARKLHPEAPPASAEAITRDQMARVLLRSGGGAR